MESSWIRDQTHGSCISRRTPIHCTTRELLASVSKLSVPTSMETLYCYSYVIHLIFLLSFLWLSKSWIMQTSTQVQVKYEGVMSMNTGGTQDYLPGKCFQWQTCSCCSLVAKSCPTVCDPMVNRLPGSFLHGICQSRILEWVVSSFSRGSSQPRDIHVLT